MKPVGLADHPDVRLLPLVVRQVGLLPSVALNALTPPSSRSSARWCPSCASMSFESAVDILLLGGTTAAAIGWQKTCPCREHAHNAITRQGSASVACRVLPVSPQTLAVALCMRGASRVFSSRRRQPSAAIGRPGAREAHLRGVPGRTGTWRSAVAGDRLLRPRGNGKTALLARLHREAAKYADEVDVIHLTPSTIATEERLIGRLAARWWQRLVPGELSIRGVRGQPGRGARPRWTRCWLLVRRKSRCCCCWTRPTLWMRKSAMRC